MTATALKAVRFEIPRIPASRNSNRSHVAYGRGAANSRHGTTMEWRRLGELYGSQALIAAGWAKAKPGQRATVSVEMHRVHLILDRENKFGACKDLVDSLCRYHRVRVPVPGGYRYERVDGLGLIYDDTDVCDGGLIDLIVTQVKVMRIADQRTVVVVERLP